VVTRGAVAAEGVEGGFSAAYRVLAAFEETGQARRGYVVEGLGAAQFAMDGAVDRLRSLATARERGPSADSAPRAVVLAAADPANAYGAALPWPEQPPGVTHRPGRKAGALVVLVDGDLVLWVERGGRTLLSWPDPPGAAGARDGADGGVGTRLQAAADALALAVREGALGRLTVERANGESALSSPLGSALEQAGFHATPRGLRLRS
jgi:ATP-dependent Lhr-like helicase